MPVARVAQMMSGTGGWGALVRMRSGVIGVRDPGPMHVSTLERLSSARWHRRRILL